MNTTVSRWGTVLILLVSALWIIASRAEAGSTTGGGIPAPRQGFMAPDFALPSFAGENLRLSELRGQAVIVNVWASWCPPCQAEMPALQKVYEDYHDQGVEILGVNAANSDKEADARAKAAGWGLTFPLLLDFTGEVSRQYQIQSLPTTFFIDGQGVVRNVVVGGPMSEALLRIEVEKLLAQKAAP
jgi:peroxiredoxin